MAAIEGEKLDIGVIRSSVARRLGLSTAGLPKEQRHIQGLVDMLLDATQNYSQELTAQRLRGWQAGLFPLGFSSIHEITVGEWRKGTEPMRVISGKMGQEKIHFEAPPSRLIPKAMSTFLKWFNSQSKIDGLVRAAIAHFWFVTIHPFEDGNGRVARTITDLALAQDETSAKRCYSLSSQISKDRESYYKILEKTQKGNLDISPWIIWFLQTIVRAIEDSEKIIEKTLLIGNFWKANAQIDLNPRQKKVLQKMLELEPNGFVGGITNRKYVGLTKVSAASAKRDISDLEEKGLLKRNEPKGRSINYSLVLRKK